MSDDRSTLFLTTRWTLVGDAVQAGDAGAREALGVLFMTYWRPLYRYVRRAGRSKEDAEDLVQGFLEHLLEGNGLRLADRERGRFRAFLLGSLKHYMINEWRREHRQKRQALEYAHDYEMLTGERPGKDLVPPSRKVEIDVKLDEMVLRALEKQPERRSIRLCLPSL